MRINLPFPSLILIFLLGYLHYADAQPHPTSSPFVDKLVDIVSERSRLRLNQEKIDLKILVARKRLDTIQADKPRLLNRWQEIRYEPSPLMQGEFESRQDFARREVRSKGKEVEARAEYNNRREKAKLDEELAYSHGLSLWNDTLDKARSELRRIEHEATAFDTETSSLLNSERITTVFKPNVQQLPRFDQGTMSFGGLTFASVGMELRRSGSIEKFAKLDFEFPEVRIRFKSLESAKKFKEDFSEGKTELIWAFEPTLLREESPIVDVPERREVIVERELDSKGLVTGLAAVALAAAIGKTDYTAPPIMHKSTAKTIVHPAVTRQGTRYHFRLKPDAVFAKLKGGQIIEEAEVVMIGVLRIVEVMEVMKDAQQSVQHLARGDRILAIAGKSVSTPEEMINALHNQPLGKHFNVLYRAINERENRTFQAEGGKPLGVNVQAKVINE